MHIKYKPSGFRACMPVCVQDVGGSVVAYARVDYAVQLVIPGTAEIKRAGPCPRVYVCQLLVRISDHVGFDRWCRFSGISPECMVREDIVNRHIIVAAEEIRVISVTDFAT